MCADTEMRVVQVDTMIVMMTTPATCRGPGAGVAGVGVCGLLLGLGLVQPLPLAVLRPPRLLHRSQPGGQGAERPGGQVTTALLSHACPLQADLAASPAAGRARARPTSPGPWMARPWRLPRTAARCGGTSRSICIYSCSISTGGQQLTAPGLGRARTEAG